MDERKFYPYLDSRLILGLRAGDDFVYDIGFTDEKTGEIIPLTGFSAILQLRDVETDALLMEDDSITGSITIDEAGGKVNFATPAAKTVLVPPGVCKYGLRMIDGNGKSNTWPFGPCDVAECLVKP